MVRSLTNKSFYKPPTPTMTKRGIPGNRSPYRKGSALPYLTTLYSTVSKNSSTRSLSQHKFLLTLVHSLTGFFVYKYISREPTPLMTQSLSSLTMGRSKINQRQGTSLMEHLDSLMPGHMRCTSRNLPLDRLGDLPHSRT